MIFIEFISDVQKQNENIDRFIDQGFDLEAHLLVSTSGASFVFSDREDSFALLFECFQNRYIAYTNKLKDRNLHPICFLADGPGSGKSRYLQEIQMSCKNYVKSMEYNQPFKGMINDAISMNITFGNGTPYSEFDRTIGIEKALCLRILGLYTSNEDAEDFVRDYSKDGKTLLNSVLHAVAKNHNCILIGIDEVNKVHELDKLQFKQLFNLIGGLSCCFQPFFIPILAGTVIGPIQEIVTKSTHPPFRISLPLLSYESSVRILEEKGGTKLSQTIQENKSLQNIIYDIGGHCRALEILYDVLCRNNHDNMQTILNDVSFTLIDNK